jgi:hypothetical protein
LVAAREGWSMRLAGPVEPDTVVACISDDGIVRFVWKGGAGCE